MTESRKPGRDGSQGDSSAEATGEGERALDPEATRAQADNPLLRSEEELVELSDVGDRIMDGDLDDDDEDDAFDESTALVDPAEYMRSLRKREEQKLQEGNKEAEVAIDAIPHIGHVQLPARLGEYTLVEMLGLGGMAEVFLAKQEGIEGFEKTLVIKRIHPHLSQDERFKKMFLREAKVASGLHHRNIVQLYELGQDRGIYFMAMEYVEGLTLLKLARRAWRSGLSLPMELAVSAAADAASGLYHAHTFTDEQGTPKRIVHRDVSPDNLIINRQGLTKLLDFGVAKAADSISVTRAGEVKGKIPYMAPEQLHGKPVDGRADLYSLGATLYWLLTGRRPFHGENDVALMQAIAYEQPVPPRKLNPEIPEPIEQIILKLLSKKAEDRFESGEDLADTLFRYVPPSRREVAAFVDEAIQLEDDDEGGPISTASFIAATPRTAHFITTSRKLAEMMPSESTESIDLSAARAPLEATGTADAGRGGALDISDAVDESVSSALDDMMSSIDDEPAVSTDPGSRPLAPYSLAPGAEAAELASIDLSAEPGTLGGETKNRRPMAMAAAASAVVLLAVVGVFALVGDDPEDDVPPPPQQTDTVTALPDEPDVGDDGTADGDGAPAGDGDGAPVDGDGTPAGDDDDDEGWAFEDVGDDGAASDEAEGDGATAGAEAAATDSATAGDNPGAGDVASASDDAATGDDATVTPPTPEAPPEPPPPTAKRSGPPMKIVKGVGPKWVKWTTPRGTALGRGNANLRIPKTARTVMAVDTRRNVRSKVKVKADRADYANVPKGTLDIRAFPFAKVTVGRTTLGTTPFKPMSVPAGTYKLKLTYEGKSKSQTVTVSSGKTAKVRVNMTE